MVRIIMFWVLLVMVGRVRMFIIIGRSIRWLMIIRWNTSIHGRILCIMWTIVRITVVGFGSREYGSRILVTRRIYGIRTGGGGRRR